MVNFWVKLRIILQSDFEMTDFNMIRDRKSGSADPFSTFLLKHQKTYQHIIWSLGMIYSVLPHHFRKLGFGIFFLSYCHVDDADGILAVHALACDGELIVGAIGGGATAYAPGRAQWELVVGAGEIEDDAVGEGQSLPF